jgi:hypothetical protein
MTDNTADGSARRTLILTLAGLVVAVAAAIGTWYGVLKPSTAPAEPGAASVGTGIATVGEQRIDGDVSITGPAGPAPPTPAAAAGRAAAGVGMATVGEQTVDGSVTIDATPEQPRP